jgi:3-hydroxyisobutyrate dehydrogenase
MPWASRTQEAFSLFEHFNPGQTLPARAGAHQRRTVDKPSFEIAMARKDVRLMIEEAQRGGVDLFVMPGVAAMFDAGDRARRGRAGRGGRGARAR